MDQKCNAARLLHHVQGTVFHCWENMAETVIHSELGASQAIVKAGFNLDSLMLRYQVDPRLLPIDCQNHGGILPIDYHDFGDLSLVLMLIQCGMQSIHACCESVIFMH